MHRIKRKADGIIVSKLLIDMLRTSVNVFLLEENATSFGDELMICAAIFIGQAEGKPFTAGKIASYIGMPRPTVVRKLQSLLLRGFILSPDNKRWRLALERGDISARVNSNICALSQAVHRAAAELSKVDSMAIARPKHGK